MNSTQRAPLFIRSSLLEMLYLYSSSRFTCEPPFVLKLSSANVICSANCLRGASSELHQHSAVPSTAEMVFLQHKVTSLPPWRKIVSRASTYTKIYSWFWPIKLLEDASKGSVWLRTNWWRSIEADVNCVGSYFRKWPIQSVCSSTMGSSVITMGTSRSF